MHRWNKIVIDYYRICITLETYIIVLHLQLIFRRLYCIYALILQKLRSATFEYMTTYPAMYIKKIRRTSWLIEKSNIKSIFPSNMIAFKTINEYDIGALL